MSFFERRKPAVRIVHYCGDSYTVRYSRFWLWPEKTYGEADTNYSFPSLMHRNKLLLNVSVSTRIRKTKNTKLLTLDEAKKLAASLTEAGVALDEEFGDDYWDDIENPWCKACCGTGGDLMNDGIIPCEECDGMGYQGWV